MPYKRKNLSIPSLTVDLALLLGMFAGDGCLPISHNGDGNRIYPIRFYNTKKSYVDLFSKLFFTVFGVEGKLFCRYRENKLPLWEFSKYSVDLFFLFQDKLEMPSGKKALRVGVPSFILSGSKKLQKHFFYGLLLTDGSFRATNDMMFHVASKQLLVDLAQLIFQVWGFERDIVAYKQGRHISYQLTLNTVQSSTILQSMPSSHNLVLR